MYSARAKNGSAVAVAPTHRITSIAGETVEYYLVDTIPLPCTSMRPTLQQAELVTIEPLTYAGGVVTAGAPQTLKAQLEWKAARRHGSDRTPDRPAAKGSLIVLAANQKQVSKLLQLDFADSLEGKAFAQCYSFARVVETVTGADPDAGDPGSASDQPFPIVYDNLQLETQYDTSRGNDVVIGDLCITVDREQVTEAQLLKAAYFTLTPQGGQPRRYTLWNSKEGIKPLNTHHWAIYLRQHK